MKGEIICSFIMIIILSWLIAFNNYEIQKLKSELKAHIIVEDNNNGKVTN